MNLDEGRARIEGVVDETVAAVLPDDVETKTSESGPGLCDDENEGHVGYEHRFSVEDLDTDELFTETEKFWNERGFSTKMVNPDSRLPALFAGDDEGFSYSLQVSPIKKMGWLGGGTPCLEKA